MSSTANMYEEADAIAATENNHHAGVGSLEDGVAAKNHNMTLTSRDDVDDHAPKSESLTASRSQLEEGDQVLDAQVDQLYKSLETLGREMSLLRSRMQLHIFCRTSERKIGYHRSGLQEYEDIQNISPDRLRQVQIHLEHDAYCALQLSALSEKYRVLRQNTSNALNAANQTLANVVLLSGKKSYQKTQEAVSRFEKYVAAFNRDVNELMLGVLVSDP
ncbi:hypothetical protein KCU81_g6785, partial [Aureobasidium melanogenum]|uniref:Uncharacterized protein n=1 Tax=Aureobasidium melanogenum (strain CBS 110374) TaxID=1043003 RepID=A0A074VNX4_AURM1